jgi:cytoskeletal protein RodZ
MVGENVAGGFIDAMKGQPVALAMVVVILALLGLLYYQSALFSQQRADNIKMFVQTQTDVQKILTQCIVPAK